MEGSDLLCLSKTRDLIQFNEPLISKKTKPIQLAKLIDQAKKAVARFTKLTKSITIKTEPGGEADNEAVGELQALKTDFEREIFLSAIHPELRAIYDGDYFGMEIDIAVMEKNLTTVIGAVDNRTLNQSKLANFEALQRRTDIQEHFQAYLARIEKEAALITTTEFAENLIVMQFEKSLRPSDWDALQFRADMDKTGKERVQHFAQTLDKMKIYEKTRAATHQIAPQVDMQKQFDDFQAAILAKVESGQARFEKLETDLVKMFEAKLNMLTSAPSSAQTAKEAAPKAPKPKQPKPKSEVKFCFVCGGKTCKKGDECEGRPDIKCFLCDEFGHFAMSRKFHGKKQPKN